jgi:hypothetical protein
MSPLETSVVSRGTGGSKSCADPTSARGGGAHDDPAPGWPRDRLRCNLPPSAPGAAPTSWDSEVGTQTIIEPA